MQRSESIASIAKALSEFQGDVKQPKKDADNPFFSSKYVPLDNIVDVINACGPKFGLSFTQWPSVHPESGRIGVTTMIMHSSGEWLEFDPLFMKSDKDTAQGAGSVITYARRYALSAAYGLASDEDDDGNTASGDPNKAPKTSNTQAQTNTPSNTSSINSVSTGGVKFVSEPQSKLLYNKLKAGELSLERLADFIGYPLESTKSVRFSDMNKILEWIEKKGLPL